MRYVLFAITAPWSVIVGWGWLLILFCVGAIKDFRWEPTLVLTATWRDWVTKERVLPWSPRNRDGSKKPIPLWGYSTTLGRGIVYWPTARAPGNDPWTRTQHHEHVHVRQAEDRMMWMLIIGLVVMLIVGPVTGDWGLAVGLFFGLWFSGGASQTVNWLTAVMRGGDFYRDSEHELSAFAQTDTMSDGRSWLQNHNERD